MLISKAYASAENAVTAVTTAAAASAPAPMAAPGPLEAFALNMLLILILVVLFYVLLIMPQQKRFKQHRAMLDSLRKGDKVVAAGGLVGTVDKVQDGGDIVVDLGNGIKVTALRSSIQTRVESGAGAASGGSKAA